MKKDFADVRAYTTLMADEIISENAAAFHEMIRLAIESDIDRLNDDRWKRFARSPDTIKWKDWMRDDVKRRITDAMKGACGDRKRIRRMLFPPQATDIAKMTMARIGRTAVAGAAGYIATLPLVGGNPILAAVGALAAVGGEKAGREVIKKNAGSSIGNITSILESLLKLVSFFRSIFSRSNNKGGDESGG